MKTDQKRNEIIRLRVSEFEKNIIQGLADIYAEGDISAWLRWAGINAERKKVSSKKPRGAKAPRRSK